MNKQLYIKNKNVLKKNFNKQGSWFIKILI
jgi:hypothetical protein